VTERSGILLAKVRRVPQAPPDTSRQVFARGVLSINTTRHGPRDSPSSREGALGGPPRVVSGGACQSMTGPFFSWKPASSEIGSASETRRSRSCTSVDAVLVSGP
jgi:hypothetical protein